MSEVKWNNYLKKVRALNENLVEFELFKKTTNIHREFVKKTKDGERQMLFVECYTLLGLLVFFWIVRTPLRYLLKALQYHTLSFSVYSIKIYRVYWNLETLLATSLQFPIHRSPNLPVRYSYLELWDWAPTNWNQMFV